MSRKPLTLTQDTVLKLPVKRKPFDPEGTLLILGSYIVDRTESMSLEAAAAEIVQLTEEHSEAAMACCENAGLNGLVSFHWVLRKDGSTLHRRLEARYYERRARIRWEICHQYIAREMPDGYLLGATARRTMTGFAETCLLVVTHTAEELIEMGGAYDISYLNR